MNRSTRFFAAITALAALIGAPQAQASTTLDFNNPNLTGLYFGGDSFAQGAFTFTQHYDFATIDTAARSGLGALAPTGNSTQFYIGSNDGDVLLSRTDGGAFSLDGFSAAFVPLPAPHAAQTIVIVALATTMTGTNLGTYFSLGTTTSTTAGSPFLNFVGADFDRFTNLASVDFFGCVLTSSSVCSVASQNNAQFALDNVLVTAAVAPVPEPSTWALMAAGLLACGFFSRRRNT